MFAKICRNDKTSQFLNKNRIPSTDKTSLFLNENKMTDIDITSGIRKAGHLSALNHKTLAQITNLSLA